MPGEKASMGQALTAFELREVPQGTVACKQTHRTARRRITHPLKLVEAQLTQMGEDANRSLTPIVTCDCSKVIRAGNLNFKFEVPKKDLQLVLLLVGPWLPSLLKLNQQPHFPLFQCEL